jgi:hypothetical protein
MAARPAGRRCDDAGADEAENIVYRAEPPTISFPRVFPPL